MDLVFDVYIFNFLLGSGVYFNFGYDVDGFMFGIYVNGNN